MALYKNANLLKHDTSPDFDKLHSPGIQAPHPGIYRCPSCGDEIAIAGGHVLPPQNHHQHRAGIGPIKWQLVVYAQQVK